MPQHKPSRYPWAHHYGQLMAGWRKAYRAAGLRMEQYTEADGYPLYFLETKRKNANAPSLFLSAGIHGDEAAPPVALLEWVIRNPELAKKLNLIIFPCLNPWGLVNNRRVNAAGVDLNRSYQDDRVPQTVAHRKVLHGRRFTAALALHEDYDAQGVYVYEVPREKLFWAGKLLTAAAKYIPIEPRMWVDKRKMSAGILRRNVDMNFMPERPESLHLFFYHAKRAFTLETPSEYFLDTRVEAQVAGIQACAKLCLKHKNASE
ncbi:MAG: M14 family metallocarboxypeptidase [Chthoniobacterales bacterium]